MDKETALTLFFKKNDIKFDRASDEFDGNYDCRIAELPSKIDCWLSYIDSNDHDLFLTLLSKYTYLTTAQCQNRYSKILSLLQTELEQSNTTLSDVLFISVEAGGAHKSGSDNVRADLYSRNIRKISKRQIIAAQSKLNSAEIQQYKIVVFLDDIVGSGITLWNSIKDFYLMFLKNAANKPKLYFSSIVPRKRGIKHIQSNCKNACIEIKALIDPSWYVSPAFDNNCNEYLKMEKYENIVGNYMMNDTESFFMGFQTNRLLVSFYYNTPNNTLSTFWRVVPEINDPPFYRDGNQPRPSIDDLKERSKKMRNSAYAYGIDINTKLEHHDN